VRPAGGAPEHRLEHLASAFNALNHANTPAEGEFRLKKLSKVAFFLTNIRSVRNN